MDAIKHTILKVLHYSGTNNLVRLLSRKNPRIVMLHQVLPTKSGQSGLTSDIFEQMVGYIKKNYQPLTVSELIDFKRNNGFYPENAVVITFDDGFQSFYDLALPILREYGVPATVFICPLLVEKESWIWPDCFTYVYRKKYHLQCDKSLKQLLNELKRMSTAKRNGFISNAFDSCGLSFPKNIPEEYRLMSWGLLKELAGCPLVEIGSHTLTHPILAMEDTDTSWNEIMGSRQMLQQYLDVPVHTFCFPNGQPEDYHGSHLDMLRRAGYHCGIASHFGSVTMNSDDMALPRISFGSSIFANYKQLNGVEYLQRKLMGEIVVP